MLDFKNIPDFIGQHFFRSFLLISTLVLGGGLNAYADTGTSRVNLNFRGCINGCDTGKNIRPGEKFDVLSQKGSWLRVKFKGQEGWVYKGSNRNPYVKVSKGSSSGNSNPGPSEVVGQNSSEDDGSTAFGTLDGIRNGSSLNIRQKPSSRSRRLGAIENPRNAAPETVEIIGEAKNGWYKVKTSSGVIGYVSDNYIKKIPAAATPQNSNTADAVRSETVPGAGLNTPAQVSPAPAVRETSATPAASNPGAGRFAGTTSDDVAAAMGLDDGPSTDEDQSVDDTESEAGVGESASDEAEVAETETPQEDRLVPASAQTEADICTDCDGQRRDVMMIPKEVLVASAKLMDPVQGKKLKNGAIFPLPKCLGVRHDGYGGGHWHASRNGGRYRHTGIDWHAPIGTPLSSPWDGTVISSTRGKKAGHLVKIRHTNGYVSVYMHLNSRDVRHGQKIKAGQRLGTVGDTGNAGGTMPHVHFELKKHGRRINPGTVFGCTHPA